jgi:hypothetical protein
MMAGEANMRTFKKLDTMPVSSRHARTAFLISSAEMDPTVPPLTAPLGAELGAAALARTFWTGVAEVDAAMKAIAMTEEVENFMVAGEMLIGRRD